MQMMVGMGRDRPGTGRRPEVRLPREGIPGAAIAGVAGLAALALFFVLDGRRNAEERGPLVRTPGALIASPPPLQIARAVPPQPAAPHMGVVGPVVTLPGLAHRIPVVTAAARRVEPLPQPAPPLPWQQGQGLSRPDAPPILPPAPPSYVPPGASAPSRALVVDAGIRRPRESGRAAEAGDGDEGTGVKVLVPVASRQTPTLLAAGALLPAVLETPLDTSRAGLARGFVNRDAYGADGSRIVVPKGSRLIGRYESDVGAGQDRILVTWDRLVLPDGRQVHIAAPSADRSGTPGLRGEVSGNGLGRFVTSLIRTVVDVATLRAINSVEANPVVVAMPAGAAQATGVSTAPSRRRIVVPAGTELAVFVSQDIDFADAPAPSPSGTR